MEKGERRQQLEAAAEVMNAMAAEVEGLGAGIQTLVQQASGIDAKIRLLTERVGTAGISEVGAVCEELTKTVRQRLELASQAAGLNMKCSQVGNRLRCEARKVKPARIFDTVGKKLFGEAA